jgi:cation:H+ antiporter
MDSTTLILFVVGAGLLIFGAETLVRGAARLAASFGITPLVIGLTVVAFGTSTPELAVTTQAGLAGKSDIALGNVVGSNIANILLILGLSAAIVPLTVSHQLVRLDVPLMIGASVLVFLMALNGTIGNWDGILLLAGVLAYTFFLVRHSRRQTRAEREREALERARVEAATGVVTPSSSSTVRSLILVAVGLALLLVGGRWMVNGAVELARAFGVSELVIGLTVVAGGTSLPEVATSLMASIRGHRDMAVGNVVGSNIYNLLLILGTAALVTPGGVIVPPAAIRFDLPVMIAVAVACVPIFFANQRISRWEGMLFVGYYLAYTTYLILDASSHDALPAFSGVMGFFVIPLTLVALLAVALRGMHRQRHGRLPREK